MRSALRSFIERWLPAVRTERPKTQAFLMELCLVLELPRPGMSGGAAASDDYVLDREVPLPAPDGTVGRGRIDLYKKGCFVFQVTQRRETSKASGSRQGHLSPGDDAMERGRTEAVSLARNVEPRPPFLVVCEIGRWFELLACFDGSARYRPFPDAETSRFPFQELERHADTLRTVWIDPYGLDCTKEAEQLAVQAGSSLASLAEDLRQSGHREEAVADFLLAFLLVVFAEDFGLLPPSVLRRALGDQWIPDPATFPSGIERLWRGMGDRFFRRSFRRPRALQADARQLEQLLGLANVDWSRVDAAVFGELLGRALLSAPPGLMGERLTPRAHIERLVQPTVEAPLRADWDAVRTEASILRERGEPEAAREAVRAFRSRLARAVVLDPACGTGGFLCVALSFLQRLDSEAAAELRALGDPQEPLLRVSPAQVRGIETSPRSAEIAGLVLWLSHLQWHARSPSRQGPPPRPLPGEMEGIEIRDALLAWDAREPMLDGKGKPVREQYVRPRRTKWPQADFIVGNPPFLGPRRMPLFLEEGYMVALRAAYPKVPAGSDLAMYWWQRAAELAREGAIRRFGLILPNAFTTAFRSALGADLDDPNNPLRIVLAFPNHPLDEAGLVLVAMVVAQRAADPLPAHALLGSLDGGAGDAVSYRPVGRIDRNLGAGPGPDAVAPLEANAGLFSRGLWIHGSGFVLSGDEQAEDGAINPATHLPVVRPYMTGRGLMGRSEGARVIDFCGLSEEEARAVSPRLFERVASLVKPEREHARTARAALRERWWRFANDARGLREALGGLGRYIATSQIARRRVFVFLDQLVLPDTTLSCIALEDAYFLGVLSSRVHVTWASAAGASIVDAQRYDRASCFEPFPFPACTELQKRSVREIAESLDAHRKAALAACSELTLTGMYNVLSKLRAGDALDERDRRLQHGGQISALRRIHDELDRAVLDAYGWARDLTGQAILEKVVALNHERRREEQAGVVRWSRPRFQRPDSSGARDTAAGAALQAEEPAEDVAAPTVPLPTVRIRWPATLAEQIAAVRDLVATSNQPWSTTEIASVFEGAKKRVVAEILDGLARVDVLQASSSSAEEPRWSLAFGGWT